MQTFDYFVGNLKCRKCGVISDADEYTNMQTKICLHPRQWPYGVGDRLEIDVDNIEKSGYLCISKPNNTISFNLIDTWECPSCDEPFNWAVVKIENSRIVEVKEIMLTNQVSEVANYITNFCLDLGWQFVNNTLQRSIINEDE